jgi:hypothetical protein
VQAQHGDLLILDPVGGELAAAAVEDEAVGAVPVLDDVEALVDLAAKGQAVQVATKKGGAQRLAELDEGPVGRVLEVVIPNPADRFRMAPSVLGGEPWRRWRWRGI